MHRYKKHCEYRLEDGSKCGVEYDGIARSKFCPDHKREKFVPKPGKEYREVNGEMVVVAKNGALYDAVEGGFVEGGVVTTAITKETAVDMARLRAEKRRKIVMEAANEAVENRTWTQKYKDYAFVAALANTAMIKATTPDDPKAIEAGRFVLAQAGLLEDEEQPEGRMNESVLAALGREAVEQILARAKAERGE